MTEKAREPQMGLNFEYVWAALLELREIHKETAQKIEALAKSSTETERLLRESSTETDKEIKALAKNIGGLSNSLGKLVEQMFSAQLWEKFDALGYEFTKGSNLKFRENKQLIAEVDIFLENGEYAMPVEVKTHLREEDVDRHIQQIELIRGYMDRRDDKRQLVGAVADGVVPDDVRRYAQRLGLYVLEQSGESVTIAESPDDFTARVW
ncbi:MAG: hypothetical protein LBD79_10035 [Treponema sp.]|jgi:hypothetical protein|nr:hypothetical protein [Treponema sp.]